MTEKRGKTAERQAEWTDDAIVEPSNSTVDDWIGQRVDRDAERADEAVAAADSEAEAERLFDERTERRPGEPLTDGDPTSS
jgi:hypothetical protein